MKLIVIITTLLTVNVYAQKSITLGLTTAAIRINNTPFHYFNLSSQYGFTIGYANKRNEVFIAFAKWNTSKLLSFSNLIPMGGGFPKVVNISDSLKPYNNLFYISSFQFFDLGYGKVFNVKKINIKPQIALSFTSGYKNYLEPINTYIDPSFPIIALNSINKKVSALGVYSAIALLYNINKNFSAGIHAGVRSYPTIDLHQLQTGLNVNYTFNLGKKKQ